MAAGDTVELKWRSAMALGKETTWGTAVSVTAYAEFLSEEFTKERETILLDGVNNQRTPSKRITGNEDVTGSLSLYANPADDFFANLIKQCLGGTVSSSIVATGTAYAHTFNVGDMENNAATSTASDMKSLTVKVRKGATKVWEFSGMRVNTLSLKSEQGQPIMCEAELIGRYATQGSSTFTSISYAGVLPPTFRGITVKSAATLATITSGTGTADTYLSWELTINNNLDNSLRKLGSRNLAHLPQGRLDVSMTLQQLFDTTTAYDTWESETTTAFGIWLDSGVTIGAGGSTYSMAIYLPHCYLNYKIPGVDGRDGALQHELQYDCLQSGTSSYPIQIVMNNATADYE